MTLPEFKKILGNKADGMTDKEIQQVLDIELGLADVLFYLWIKNKDSKNYHQKTMEKPS